MKCSGRTRSGKPCPRSAAVGKNTCWLHDPGRAQERVRNARIAAKSARPRKCAGDLPHCPTAIRELPGFLALVVDRTLAGSLDPKLTNAAAYTISQMRAAIELGVVEQRLSELEKRIEGR